MKWSRKYDKCINCFETKVRHKGKGLCVHCFDKKRAKSPKRKAQLKAQQERYYKKHKDTEEYKQKVKERSQKWYNTAEYKRNIREVQMPYNRVRYFLLKQKKFDKRHNGVEIIIEGKKVKTNIKPLTMHSEKDDARFMRELQIFKKVYKNYENIIQRRER